MRVAQISLQLGLLLNLLLYQLGPWLRSMPGLNLNTVIVGKDEPVSCLLGNLPCASK